MIDQVGGLEECPNIPRTIASVIMMGMATLMELDTHYGLEDVYDLLEIAAVESHNRKQIVKAREREMKGRR